MLHVATAVAEILLVHNTSVLTTVTRILLVVGRLNGLNVAQVAGRLHGLDVAQVAGRLNGLDVA